MSTEQYPLSWKYVMEQLRDVSDDTVIQVAVSEIAPPESAGLFVAPFIVQDGLPIYASLLDPTTGFLVHHMGDNYQIKKHRFVQTDSNRALPTNTPTWNIPAPATPATQQKRAAQENDRAIRPVPVEVLTTRVESRQIERRSLLAYPAEQPGATVLFTTFLGATVGLLAGGGRGAAYGAMIGVGAGLAAVVVSTAVTSPVVAAAAQTMFMGLAAAALSGSGGSRILRLTPARPAALPQGQGGDESPPVRRIQARRTQSKK
jgi:hypothetical protein